MTFSAPHHFPKRVVQASNNQNPASDPERRKCPILVCSRISNAPFPQLTDKTSTTSLGNQYKDFARFVYVRTHHIVLKSTDREINIGQF